jgi:hypothetical protein
VSGLQVDEIHFKDLTRVDIFNRFGICHLELNARSSKGRTAGFGPVSGGSNPPRATQNFNKEKG